MDRRSFLKSTSAIALASLVPTWLSAPKRPPLNLTAFCDENIRRYDCSAPFTQQAGDSFSTYATDGKIVVKVASDWMKEGTHNTDAPPANRLYWDHDTERGWKPWPKQQWVNDIGNDPICYACKGNATEGHRNECKTCHGTGNEYVGTNYHESRAIHCRQCGGNGMEKPHCKTCSGRGFIIDGPRHQLVGHAQVGCIYDNLLRRECGEMEYVIISRPAAVIGKSKRELSDLVLFRFAGGTGILLPLTPK